MITLFLLLSTAYASKEAPSPLEFQAIMKLDYQSFDQDLKQGGWRGIADKAEAGKVLDAYHIHNFDKLDASQHGIIYWHAGQTYAMANLTEVALARFRKSYDPNEKPNDPFKWNAYVKGSIAFLEKDKPALIEARNELRVANKIKPNGNLKFLESFVQCFEKTYAEAYTPACK